MAAITGAVTVSSGWLPWSGESKLLGSNLDVGVSDTKPVPRAKRAVAKSPSALTPPTEPSASSAPSARSIPSIPSETIAPTPVVVAPAPSAVRERRAARALAASEIAHAFVAALPAERASAEAPALRVEPAATLFAEANRARRDGNVDRAVGLYRSLQSRYPNSSESELSRALLAQLLLDRGDPEAALAGFDRYLAEDTPVLSAEALVGRARALEQLGKSTQAAAAWRKVQSRFPGSVHARLAATRLAALGMR
jgi:TolA-binding protein